MTSYRWGVPPSIPGEPTGMPGTAKPMAVGRFSRSRRTAVAGTCPSSTYPSIYSEASIFEMAHPTRAATAIWIFMNQNCRGLGLGGMPLQNEKGGDQTQHTSPRHTAQFVRHVDSPFVA
jgi:hypothetical protein